MKLLLALLLYCPAYLYSQAPLPSPTGGTGGAGGGGTVSATNVSQAVHAVGAGTAQAQTAAFSPAVGSLFQGLTVCWLPAAANSGAGPTFSPNGLTATVIVKQGGGALVANDILSTAEACAIYDLANVHWELQNPQTSGGGTGNAAALVTTAFSATPTFTCPSASAGTEVSFVLSTALSANITSSTLASCTSGSQLNFRFGQAPNTTAYTVAMPTGFSAACQVSPIFSSNTNMSFIWDGSTARLIACSVDSGPSVGVEQAAPSQTPVSGSPFWWFDSTQHNLRLENSSSVFFSLSKELSSGNVRCAGGANAVDTACSSGQVQAALGIVTELFGGTGAANTPGAAGHVLRSNATHYVDSAIQAADVPATPVPAPGTSITLTAPRAYAICTGTCTVTVPVPAAGYEFCAMNDDNVSTAITLAALGSSAMYENQARTAYGTAGTGTLVVAAAAANKVCIVGRDATHYLTVSNTGGAITVN